MAKNLPTTRHQISNQFKLEYMSADQKDLDALSTTVNRELTFGEKAVGLTFNPGGHYEVETIKKMCANLIDELNGSRSLTTNSYKKRMYTEAITDIQTGQMWAVKAATWQY
jgi:hypothetical protein